MGMPRGTKPEYGRMEADNSTFLTKHAGPIMLAYGADDLLIAGWLRRATGSIEGRTQYRTFAARREGPGPWNSFGTNKVPSTTGTGGEFSGVQTLSGIGNVMWIQGGLAGGLNGATPGQTDFGFQAFANSRGRVVGTQAFQIEPDLNSAKTAIYPLGPPVPALGLTGAMVCGSITGVSGTLKLNFTWREFGMDLKVPGTWNVTPLITETSITADEPDYNTGNMAITPTSGKAFVQLGLVLIASDARATLDFTEAVKY